MSLIISGTDGVTFNDSSLQGAAASPYVLKNRIINGDMRIDQRNAGASVTIPSSSATFTVDRWSGYGTQASKFTVQQNAGSVTPPAGFTNYVGVTSSSAYSVVSTDQFVLYQPLEGYNFSDLNWGSANALTITISFWVRSSLTGTFSVGIANYATGRSYVSNYTISSANTWEQKTVTIAGDTSASWLTGNSTTNGGWGYLNFNLGCGSNFQTTNNTWSSGNYKGTSTSQSVVGTNGATFYITGVQLEVGSTATPFERRLYGQELVNCQRYYQVMGGVNGGFPMATSYFSASSQTARFPISFPVVTRATPTVTKNGTWGGNASQPSVGYISSAGFAMELNSSGSGMQYSFPDSTDDTFTISAEL